MMDIEILNEERLRYWCNRINFPEPAVNELARISSITQDDKDLTNIFQSFYDKTVLQGGWNRDLDEFPIDPIVTEKLGEGDTLFYLIAHLAALPHAEKEYIRRGIDLAIFDATMQDIQVWLIHYWDSYGKWMFRQFQWIWHHLSCELFRLGRMQFTLGEFDYGVSALKNNATRKIILLADPELPLREDGYAYGAGDLSITGEPWQPEFTETEAGWTGNLVSPMGYVIPRPGFFQRAEWNLILKKGDTILDMHIPRKDRFAVDDCRESLHLAHNFFARYFPERRYQAGFCHTWFFSPQLQCILPADSNIVRFQREFYLFPFAGKLSFLWYYVFGEGVIDLKNAPARTSLQRSVLDWVKNDGEIFDLPGVMFHTAEEWGTQPYMREWEKSDLQRQ